MTIILPPVEVEKECYICGNKTTFTEMHYASFHHWGPVYLDTCSYEDMRPVYQVCPECGYVAYDLSEKIGHKRDIKRVMKNAMYQEKSLIFSSGMPVDAYRKVLIDIEIGNYENAVSGILSSCSLLEKSNERKRKRYGNFADPKEIYLRYSAIRLLHKILHTTEDLDRKNDIAIQIADLYRRSGDIINSKNILKQKITHNLIYEGDIQKISGKLLEMKRRGEQLTEEKLRELLRNPLDEDKNKDDFIFELLAVRWVKEHINVAHNLTEEQLNKIISFELEKIDAGDTGKYSLADALKSGVS